MLGLKLPTALPPRPNKTMSFGQRPIPVCGWIVASAMFGAGLSVAQTALPPNPPTSIANQNTLAPPIAASPTQLDTAQHHRAHVTYTDGMLQVRADNSSLNQILRDISKQTGMKITGGVADQRIYGSYGPAPVATVLQTLLDGTGTNVLLQETPTHAPEQLVLTPQLAGPTPPPPSSPSYDATETEPELPAQGAVPPPMPARSGNPAAANPSIVPTLTQPSNNVLGNPSNVSPTVSTVPVTNSVPLNSLPSPSTAQPVSGIVDAPNPPPAGSTTAGFTSQTPPDNNPNTAQPATNQTSTNGVKTPQQIYEELKQLQQQKTANPQANPQGSSAPK